MPTLVKIEFHPEAIDETRVRAWYRERSLKAETDFLTELRRAILHIREAPRTWHASNP